MFSFNFTEIGYIMIACSPLSHGSSIVHFNLPQANTLKKAIIFGLRYLELNTLPRYSQGFKSNIFIFKETHTHNIQR